MRILHISSLYYPDQVGGAEVMVSMLAEMQTAQGHQVAVACTSREEAPPATHKGVTIYRMGHGTPFFITEWAQKSRLQRAHYQLASKTDGHAVKQAAAAVADFKPDVVNTHSLSELPPLVWPAIKRQRKALVHTLHDYKSICSKGSMFRDGRACETQHLKCRALTFLHRRCESAVDAVTGVGSEILKRHIDAGYFHDVPDDLRRVIWNPVERPTTTRTRRRVAGDDIVFGFLGRIEPSKGVEVLIEAANRIARGGWKVIIAGRATDGIETYKTKAAGLPISFEGFVERDDFLDRIDCLIVPSVWPEAFGRTVAEAYLRGVPVIGSNIAGIAEQIGADRGQWLFPPGDAAALAERMSAIITTPDKLSESNPAMATLAERTRPETINDSYLDLYRSVIARPLPQHAHGI